jgi:hypothetical protein
VDVNLNIKLIQRDRISLYYGRLHMKYFRINKRIELIMCVIIYILASSITISYAEKSLFADYVIEEVKIKFKVPGHWIERLEKDGNNKEFISRQFGEPGAVFFVVRIMVRQTPCIVRNRYAINLILKDKIDSWYTLGRYETFLVDYSTYDSRIDQLSIISGASADYVLKKRSSVGSDERRKVFVLYGFGEKDLEYLIFTAYNPDKINEREAKTIIDEFLSSIEPYTDLRKEATPLQ